MQLIAIGAKPLEPGDRAVVEFDAGAGEHIAPRGIDHRFHLRHDPTGRGHGYAMDVLRGKLADHVKRQHAGPAVDSAVESDWGTAAPFGNLTVNVLPWPTVLVTASVPSIAVRSRR